MREKFIDKIKDCCLDFGLGVGIIIGIAIMLITSQFLNIILEYNQSIFLSIIIAIIFATTYVIKGIRTRNKLKTNKNWHGDDTNCVTGKKEKKK